MKIYGAFINQINTTKPYISNRHPTSSRYRRVRAAGRHQRQPLSAGHDALRESRRQLLVRLSARLRTRRRLQLRRRGRVSQRRRRHVADAAVPGERGLPQHRRLVRVRVPRRLRERPERNGRYADVQT